MLPIKNQATPVTLDGYLIFSVLSLLLFGLVMVASASIAVAEHHGHSGFYFLTKQAIFALFSLGVSYVILHIPSDIWQKLGFWWLILGIVLLLLVLVPGIGHSVNGSRRWLRLGPVALQVSELVKMCGIMYIANYLMRNQQAIRSGFLSVIKPLALLAVMALLLLLEPDFGATVVLFATCLGMMFIAGVQLRWFMVLILAAAALMALLVIFSPYRLARLTGFLHPWANQFGSGYQLTQSLIAFGHGGITGVGLGNSLQKLFYLPEAHTDFILAITAEECGLIGVLAIVFLFCILVWRGLLIAKQAVWRQRLFDGYLAYGVTFWLSLQAIVNIGVNIGLLPTKGLTLPLMSYGGSSLLIDLSVIAMLLRIDLQNKLNEK